MRKEIDDAGNQRFLNLTIWLIIWLSKALKKKTHAFLACSSSAELDFPYLRHRGFWYGKLYPKWCFPQPTWNQVKTRRIVLNLWVSEVLLVVKNPPADTGDIEKHRFDPWVKKVPWRRAWQPTPVFLPGESLPRDSRGITGSRGAWSPKGPLVHRVTQSRTQLQWLSTWQYFLIMCNSTRNVAAVTLIVL